MDVTRLQDDWEHFGAHDPMWAVLTTGEDAGRRWDPEEFFASGRADVAAWLQRLADAGGTPCRERALDFGCGVGRLSQALALHFDRVVGVDIARPMLAAAERHNRHGDRIQFVHNTRPDLTKFGDAEFDLVLSHIVLQHMPSRVAVGYLREFLRVLRPGGSLIFQVPTARVQRRWRYALLSAFPTVTNAYRRLRYGPSPHREMHLVPPHDVERTIHAGGGRILAIDHVDATGPEFQSSIHYAAKSVR
ncbi:hypothetical protein BH23GEM2_BH23GEM2_23480 [soil metagenome]